ERQFCLCYQRVRFHLLCQPTSGVARSTCSAPVCRPVDSYARQWELVFSWLGTETQLRAALPCFAIAKYAIVLPWTFEKILSRSWSPWLIETAMDTRSSRTSPRALMARSDSVQALFTVLSAGCWKRA